MGEPGPSDHLRKHPVETPQAEGDARPSDSLKSPQRLLPEVSFHACDEAAELQPVTFESGKRGVQTPGVGDRSDDRRLSIRVLP